MVGILYTFIGLLVFLIISWRTKINFQKLKAKSTKLRAQVVEYRKCKVPFRGDYTRINYPFVILLDDDDQEPLQLRHANSWKNEFDIGEELHVFYSDGELLYWNAFEKGLYRFLP